MHASENPPPPYLSLLIPTYGRPDLIWDTVRALLRQTRGEDEILVVDQNQPPLPVPSDCAVPALRLLRLEPPGLTRARNRALAEARHDFLLFLDDDIIPDENLLERFREAALQDGKSVWAGAVDQADLPEFAGIGFVNLDSGEIRTRFDFRDEGDLPFFPGCHVLLPRSVLPAPPEYYEAYRGNAQGEEIDLALRLLKKGVRIRALPQARVYHLKAPSGGCRSDGYRRSFHLDFCYNEGLFFGRHGHLGRVAVFLRRLKGFLEFHTRAPGGRSWRGVTLGLLHLAAGLGMGILSRPGLLVEGWKSRR